MSAPTVFYLVRHAAHGLPAGTLPGRTPGVALSAYGEGQARRLAERFAGASLDAVYTSPLERARATAAAIAARHPGLTATVSEPLNELDYGGWTGKTVAQLDASDPAWKPYNHFRSGSRPPGGEGIADVQARVVAEMRRLAVLHPAGRVVLVSHADVIRAALAYWLGTPLDLFLRIRVDPGSVSTVTLGAWGPEVCRVNEGGDLSPAD